jgi:hypothetical protein
VIPINLIPIERRVAAAKRRRIRLWSTIAGAYAGAVLIGCLVANAPLASHSPQVQADLERLAQRTERANTEKARIEAQLTQQRRQLETARAVGEHPDWSILLDAIARAKAERASLDSVTLTSRLVEAKAAPAAPPSADAASGTPAPKPKPTPTTNYTLRLTGFVVGPGEVFEFARAIEQLSVFDDVRVKDSRSAPLGAMAATRFEIEASVADAKEESR